MQMKRTIRDGSAINLVHYKPKPIYVETFIQTDMDSLWHHTQSPKLHQQWDLRFSEIHYLPRNSDDLPQLLHYKTRIGFGLHIEGTGETIASRPSRSGARTSALIFRSEQPISLIRSGSGYWQYTPEQAGIRFATEYDYTTRFGQLGRWFDRYVFRPMFGYATALSFDLLRLWLEKGLRPAAIIRTTAVHYVSIAMITMVWIWMGLVPKLLVPNGGDLKLMESLGLFAGAEEETLTLLGFIEVIFGVAAIGFHRVKYNWLLQIGMLTILTVAGLAADPSLLAAPFNPLLVSIPMFGLIAAVWLTMDVVPSASRCIRVRNQITPDEQQEGSK
ncbi:DoxX-like family protein [Paenibacillus xylaniclasticus]|uniref:DoxX-like family protein n=1 Tax=Paenibacillus xylaniclasticus TaxID=588083 RepID=UPI001759E221|nr:MULTISPECIES: DoxX-like family protein [Paenibacillus]GFN31742.1 membrane protein [Paenibacillus curdlanolyticus]